MDLPWEAHHPSGTLKCPCLEVEKIHDHRLKGQLLEQVWVGESLGGGFKYFFIFTPILGEMIQFDEHFFQMGWNHQLDQVFPGKRGCFPWDQKQVITGTKKQWEKKYGKSKWSMFRGYQRLISDVQQKDGLQDFRFNEILNLDWPWSSFYSPLIQVPPGPHEWNVFFCFQFGLLGR